MSLLSDDEKNAVYLQWLTRTGDMLLLIDLTEAAILEKLAAKELPDPCVATGWGGQEVLAYDAAQGPVIYAQGFAAGASAQLAEKPSAFQLRDEEASEHYGREIYVLYSVFDFKDGANVGNIEKVLTPLYTRREAK